MPHFPRACALCGIPLVFLMSGLLAAAQEPGADIRESGDIITLTTGAQMTGVRVVRKTATNYKVEIVDGVVMDIPVSQVSHIDYDERRPSHRGGALPDNEGNGGEIRAQEMDPALNSVLTKPLEESLTFGEQDAFRILDLISEMFGFELEFHEAVLAIPEDDRRWSIEVPAGATLLRLFRDDLPTRFPGLVAVPRFDRVYVTSRADAEAEGLIEPTANNDDTSGLDAPAG